MANLIIPGAMGDPSETVMPVEFAGSMAAAIETAFQSILQAEGKPSFETDDNSRQARDRRMLFVAIAQGIMNHLVANQAAFQIWEAGILTEASIEIKTG